MKAICNSDAAKLFFGKNTIVSIPQYACTEYIAEQIENIRDKASVGTECRSLTFTLGIPNELKDAFDNNTSTNNTDAFESDDYINGVGKALFDLPRGLETDEEYLISFGVDTVVYATEYRGFMMALSTLMQTSDIGYSEGLIYDAPAVAHRGYRVYLPGRNTMGDFIKMLDYLVYCKYNRIILEIGGAMEYKRHPLINEKWGEFCADMNSKPGRADEVQLSQKWAKNSIHSENGDGKYLTQEECRELIRECTKRGLEIIPECPTLSHSDYICLAYPHLAERQDDPYPDTYCPSDPESYKVVFDVLDEVIEVFQPKAINIGHDEFYSVGICDKCRGKDPAQIYAEDVIKIKSYLDSKGISTYMWGEKLLKARYFNGMKIGGWADPEVWSGVASTVPWMFRCADMLPRGITYLNWYWEFGEHLDDEYHAREFPVAFGNFKAIGCTNYRLRINRGVLGGYVSNWGSCADEYMQRNFQFYNLFSSGYAMWSDTYDTCDAEELHKRTLNELYKRFSSSVKNPIKVIHAANHSVKPRMFWCGGTIEESVYLLGHYEVTYTDGTRAYLPVKLGTNIASRNATEREIKEAAYSTVAIKDGEQYLFEHLYEDPHPEKKIKAITYVPKEGKEDIAIDFSFPNIEL